MKSNSTPKAQKKWSFKLPIALVLRFCKQRSITTLDLIALPEQWDKEFEWHNLKRANSYHDTMK